MSDINVSLSIFSRSTLWYPEAGLHYPVPGLAYHYLVGPERSIHSRERPFHDPEAEAGILQVSKTVKTACKQYKFYKALFKLNF